MNNIVEDPKRVEDFGLYDDEGNKIETEEKGE